MHDELDIPMPRMMPAEPSYRPPRRSGSTIDSTTRRLLAAACGIGALLLLVVGFWEITGHHVGGAVPVVQADSRPLRTKPENRGGLQIQDDAILSSAGDDGTASLAPPPETPDPQMLKQDAGKPAVAAPAVATAEPPPAQTASLSTSQPAPPPAPVAAAPEETPKPVAAKPASGLAAVQLAALGSEQAAMTEWVRLSHKIPDLLGGRQPAVTRLDRDGKTFYRLRTGGFADVAEATAFCQRVRAKGLACSLARL